MQRRAQDRACRDTVCGTKRNACRHTESKANTVKAIIIDLRLGSGLAFAEQFIATGAALAKHEVVELVAAAFASGHCLSPIGVSERSLSTQRFVRLSSHIVVLQLWKNQL